MSHIRMINISLPVVILDNASSCQNKHTRILQQSFAIECVNFHRDCVSSMGSTIGSEDVGVQKWLEAPRGSLRGSGSGMLSYIESTTGRQSVTDTTSIYSLR